MSSRSAIHTSHALLLTQDAHDERRVGTKVTAAENNI